MFVHNIVTAKIVNKILNTLKVTLIDVIKLRISVKDEHKFSFVIDRLDIHIHVQSYTMYNHEEV